jgi:hypothetical protein
MECAVAQRQPVPFWKNDRARRTAELRTERAAFAADATPVDRQ